MAIISAARTIKIHGKTAKLCVIRNNGFCWGNVSTPDGKAFDVHTRADHYDSDDDEALDAFERAAKKSPRNGGDIQSSSASVSTSPTKNRRKSTMNTKKIKLSRDLAIDAKVYASALDSINGTKNKTLAETILIDDEDPVARKALRALTGEKRAEAEWTLGWFRGMADALGCEPVAVLRAGRA